MAAASAFGADAAASCEARRVGDRVFATIELRRLVDEETRRLIQLGMKGRVQVEASVLRRRFGLFEQTIGATTTESALSSTPDGHGLALDGRTQPAPERSISLERVTVRLSGREKGPLTFRASIRLRVVTAASLARVAAWATESTEEQASSSAVTRALLAAVAEDLERTAQCSCAAADPEPHQ